LGENKFHLLRSGVDFHPSGNKMATCSGDTTIKIWDFSQKKCVHTFTNHLLPGKNCFCLFFFSISIMFYFSLVC
jgi:WD40 repeat protein